MNFSSIKSDESNQSEEYDPRSDLLAIEQINNGRPAFEDPSSTSLETLFANVFDPSLSEQVIRYDFPASVGHMDSSNAKYEILHSWKVFRRKLLSWKELN